MDGDDLVSQGITSMTAEGVWFIRVSRFVSAEIPKARNSVNNNAMPQWTRFVDLLILAKGLARKRTVAKNAFD